MANSRGFFKRQQTKGDGKAHLDYGEVTRVAYELYEQRGRADGHALDDWLNAERLVKQRSRR
jgi:hypothetical protein